MEKITNNKYKVGTIIQHIKRGTIYEIIGVGYIETSLTPAYSYKCLTDDIIWHRPITEVEETDRFVVLTTVSITTYIPSKVGLVLLSSDGTTPTGIVRSSTEFSSQIEFFDKKIIDIINNGTKTPYSVGFRGV